MAFTFFPRFLLTMMKTTRFLAGPPSSFPLFRREVLRVRLINGRRTEVCEIFRAPLARGLVLGEDGLLG